MTGSPNRRVFCQAAEVLRFKTFREMLEQCGLDACLPGCDSIEKGVGLYRSFGLMDGRSYADVEESAGVVAIRVKVL